MRQTKSCFVLIIHVEDSPSVDDRTDLEKVRYGMIIFT